MKRRKRKAHQPKKPRAAKTAPVQPEAADAREPSRRDVLRKLRNGGLFVLIAGGGGWFVVDDVRATMREHDLTQIGNGMPAVVQIHDPQCSLCVALQRETRDALCEIGEEKMQFLVANIRTDKGRELARAHGVGHVTLLLFDGEGRRRGILTGSSQADYLADEFRVHLERYGGG